MSKYLLFLLALSAFGQGQVGGVQQPSSSSSSGSFTQSGTGAVARTVDSKLKDTVSLLDFGADPTGTLASDAALTAAAIPGVAVYIPAGSYKFVSPHVFSGSHIQIVCAGPQVTRLIFAPTVSGVMFTFGPGTVLEVHDGVQNCGIQSSDTTYVKTAIKTRYVENFYFTGNNIYPWNDSTHASIGLVAQGLDFYHILDNTIMADQPISIQQSSNHAGNGIDIDQSSFTNLYMVADTSQPCVSVATGVNLSNVIFGGVQSWVLCGTGFKWIDTTSTIASYGLRIENVRTEQNTDSSGWGIDIEHNAQLQNLRITGVRVSQQVGGGIKLRKTYEARLADNFIEPGTGAAIDIDSTNYNPQINGDWYLAGSTVALNPIGGWQGTYDIDGSPLVRVRSVGGPYGTSALLSLSGNFTTTGAYNPTFSIPSSSTWSFQSGGGTVTQTIAGGALALATSSIAANSCQTVTTGSVNSVAATGVATTDAIQFTPNATIKAVTGYAPAGTLVIIPYPTAGYVNFDVCNKDQTNAVTPGAVTLNWRVAR